MKKILLPTDFSDNALNALQYAIELWGLSDTEYTLLNTYVEPSSNTSMVVSMTKIMKKESEMGLERLKEQLNEKYGSQFNVKTISHYGDVVSVMNKLYNDLGFECAAIGSKGTSVLDTMFYGSNTLNAVKSAEIPLLIVPVEKTYLPITSVALAWDEQEKTSDSAFKSLSSFIGDTGANLHVVTVHRDKIENGLTDHVKIGENTVKIDRIVSEDPSLGIQKYVAEHDIDILTLIKRHRSFIDRLFHNSVTKEISMKNNVPLFILHD